MTVLVAVIAAIAPAAAAELPAGCSHAHNWGSAKRGLRHHLHHYQPEIRRQRVRHFIRCSEQPRQWRRYARKLIAWRHGYGPSWRIRFNALPAWAQAWAWSTGACESGNNPGTSTGNGFYGAFQWVPSTWWHAGGDRWPTFASWHHQAVLAVRYMLAYGDEHWPNCGD